MTAPDTNRDQLAAALWAFSHADDAVERCTRHTWAATTWRVMECPLCKADAIIAAGWAPTTGVTEAATALAERYGDAITDIHRALDGPAPINRVRLIIAALAAPTPPTTGHGQDAVARLNVDGDIEVAWVAPPSGNTDNDEPLVDNLRAQVKAERDARDAARADLATAREQLADLRESVEELCDAWEHGNVHQRLDAGHLRAALAAVPDSKGDQ